MFVKIEPSGCCERKGLVQIRLSMYLDEGDYGYDKHYIQVPVMPSEGYLGKVGERGQPADIDDYNRWIGSLPKIWQLNPFHNHFIYVEPEVSDEEIMAQMEFHLPNFYEAWCQGWGEVKGGMGHGWAVKTRIRPKRYDKLESPEKILLRKARCEARAEDIKGILTQIKTDEKGKTFPATAIDIGSTASDRNTKEDPNYTVIDSANPANDTGAITSIEIYAVSGNDLVNCEVATFNEVDTDTFTTRDAETIGAVTGGSKQTFSGKDMDVATGDYIGIVFTGGQLERSNDAGGNYWYASGDHIPCTSQAFIDHTPSVLSLYGTGTTVVAGVGAFSQQLNPFGINIYKAGRG